MCYYTCTQLKQVLKYVASTYTLSAVHTLYVVGQITLHSLSVTLDYVTCGEWFLIPWGKDQCSHKVSGSSQQMKQTSPNLLASTSVLLLLHNAMVGAGARDYPNLMLTPPWWTMTMCLTPRKTRLGNMLSL